MVGHAILQSVQVTDRLVCDTGTGVIDFAMDTVCVSRGSGGRAKVRQRHCQYWRLSNTVRLNVS